MTIKESLRSRQSEMVRSLQELIKIRSLLGEPEPGLPFGREVNSALDYCLKLAENLGLRTGSMDGYVGWCEYGEGEELICVLTHLDIVPEGEGWTYPPFEGVIADGKIYGRGTLDNKGPAIASIYALKALADSGAPLRRRVRVLFGLGEETGCDCVRHYVNNGGEIPVMAFTPDGEFPIINGEKGICILEYTRALAPSARSIVSLEAGTAPNVVPASARAQLSFDVPSALQGKECARCIVAEGRGAHASTPDEGINAIGCLFSALGELNLDGDSRQLADFMLKYVNHDTHGKSLGIYCADEISGEITVNNGLMSVSDGNVRLTLDIRYPVTLSPDSFMPALRETMRLGAFEERSFKHSESIYTPPENELIQALARVYERETGTRAELLCIGGGTYAKTMPNCVAFGPIFPGDPMLDHQPDEHITTTNFYKNADIYAEAMYELAK